MQQTTTDASSSAAAVDPPFPTPDDGPERHALKRTYLTLLPHTQLVELCLTFEASSPLHIKNSLWPTNLADAIAKLRSVVAPPPPSSQDTENDIPSASSPPDAIIQLGTDTSIDPQLTSDNPYGHATTTTSEESTQQPQSSDDSSRPTAQPEPSAPSTHTQPPATELPQGSYPHPPYGYPPTQSLPAYPHTPYYPPLSYPHNFPPPPPASYPHAAFPPPHSPFPPAVPLARHPHPTGFPSTEHSGPSDDLPSYEDMLVEALTDLNESDGSAPKSLFTWMASRYPLHTNFRPSASQALQKAFKRGRLEKGSNGKYRLNASWDGGSTSRRTTRRPQSFVQMVLPVSHGPPTTSPFTHAPLSQPSRGTPAHNPTPTSVGEKHPPYPYFPYQYPAYPRYGSSAPPPVSTKEISTEQQPVTAVSDEAAPVERSAVDEEVGEGSDAWEAAQAILKAINFGSLLQATTVKPAAPPLPQPSPPTNLVSDRATADASAAAGPVQSLSEKDRASLQAQLALLAAQLAEIAEDTLASDLNVVDQDVHAEEDDGMVADDDDMEAVDISPQETEDALGQIVRG